MTAWQTLAGRLQGGDAGDSAGSPPDPGDPWEDAPVPAKVARRAIRGVSGADVSADRIPLLTQVMHWGYGTGWGAPYGVWARFRDELRPVRTGAMFGSAVWVMSYLQLVPMGLYEPPWRYPVKDLALDLSYHLAYGIGTGVGYELLERLSG
jgi:hypothetical protein